MSQDGYRTVSATARLPSRGIISRKGDIWHMRSEEQTHTEKWHMGCWLYWIPRIEDYSLRNEYHLDMAVGWPRLTVSRISISAKLLVKGLAEWEGGAQGRVTKTSSLPWTGMNRQTKRVGTKGNLKVHGLRSPTISTRKAARGAMAEDFPKWQPPKKASQCRHFRRRASRLIFYLSKLIL